MMQSPPTFYSPHWLWVCFHCVHGNVPKSLVINTPTSILMTIPQEQLERFKKFLKEHASTVKRKLSFQQAICYPSFRWVNILYAWTVNSVNRKHITAITFSSKPNIYPFSCSQECLLICVTNARLLACDMDEGMLGFEEKVIAVMCFGFLTNLLQNLLSMHRISSLTWNLVALSRIEIMSYGGQA